VHFDSRSRRAGATAGSPGNAGWLEFAAVSTRLALLLVLVSAVVAFTVGYETRPRESTPTAPEPASRSFTPAADVALEGVAAEVRTILLKPDLLERTREISTRLEGLGPESLEGVKAAYATIFNDLGDTDLVLFAEWWARFDPAGAFEWANSNWQAEHPAVITAVLRAWARQDPAAALQGAQVPAPNLRSAYTEACLVGWEESGIPGVLEFVKRQPAGHDRQRAIQVIARRKVLRDGPEAAFAWAETLPEDDRDFKQNVLRRVASSAAELNPRRAAEWAESLIGGEFESGLAQRVSTRWGRRDPASALEWLSTLPAGRARDDGVRETYRKWLAYDLEPAIAYVEEATLEPWLDPAVSLLARRISVDDPLGALDWAGKIRDEELRLYTTGVVARSWVIRDEPAARAWVEQADLPDYLRRKIFEIPPTMRPGALKAEREKIRAAREAMESDPE